jgi:hypothetical protein
MKTTRRPAPRPASRGFSSPDPEDDGRDPSAPAPRKPVRPTPPKGDGAADQLPPHSIEAEQGILGCVLLAPYDSMKAALEKGCSSGWFYDGRHAELWLELVEMHARRIPVDLVTLPQRLRDRNKLDVLGGLAYVSSLQDGVPSAANLGYYLETVGEKFRLRAGAQAAAQFLAGLHEHQGDVGPLLKEFSAKMKVATQDDNAPVRLKQIRLWDEESLAVWQPDPNTFLVGEAMLMRGDFAVLAGFQGIGKSRLTRTLARAGAIGKGSWMGLPVKRKFRTLILQTEDNLVRLKSEFDGLGAGKAFVRCSEQIVLNIFNAGWQDELRTVFAEWPFDILILDNWTDVAGRQEVSDAGAVFQAIMEIFPDPATRPLVLFLAHMRKPDKSRAWLPKKPWDLQHEVAGTSALAGKARTMFALQGTKEAPDGDVITFNVIKCNNEKKPLPTAWLRANGEFRPVDDFDWDQYYAPLDDGDGGRKVVTAQHLAKVFADGPLKRQDAVRAIVKLGFKEPTAYKALSADGKFVDRMTFTKDGKIGWIEEEED